MITALQYAAAESHSFNALALDPASACKWQPLNSGLDAVLLP
jgi:hypothetical protein